MEEQFSELDSFKIRSQTDDVSTAVPTAVAVNDDDTILLQMGYKQVFDREISHHRP